MTLGPSQAFEIGASHARNVDFYMLAASLGKFPVDPVGLFMDPSLMIEQEGNSPGSTSVLPRPIPCRGKIRVETPDLQQTTENESCLKSQRASQSTCVNS